ncbi:MAG: hypothetical protein NVS3B21_09800 [Acidimicrobiales bacterium]
MLTADRPVAADPHLIPRQADAQPVLVQLLVVAAAASLSAGVIHGAAIAAHSEHRSAVWTFLAVAVVQLSWGVYAVAHPSRRIAALGVVVGATTFAGWVIAKSTGLPGIDGLDRAEPMQFADGLCAALAAGSALAATAGLCVRRLRYSRSVAGVAGVLVLVMAGPGSVAAVHHHHEHDHSGKAAQIAAAVPPHPFDPSLPIDLSGVPGVTPQQQARAQNLLGATVMRLPQWSDPAYDEAHGFRSIHDGASGVEHYVNPTFIADDTMLDPDKPESLVFDTTVTPKKLVAAMYMMTPGSSLADVPDIGGPLTQWHIHNNLCFTTSGRVAALTGVDGNCPSSLIKGPATPMIHVWIVPHRCGPFAALEGVGGGQIRPGEVVACDHVHGV